MLDPYVLSWLGLLVRWFHFMMGVAWIGASFYFVWLNNTVKPPKEPVPGVAGGLWAIHGGAFYEVRKYAGAPAVLPETLHWFKWEAYLTWLSGFLLLVLHQWWNAATTMVDPNVRALTAGTAVAIGALTLFGGWLVYDGLCRSPLRKNGAALALTLFVFAVGVCWVLEHLLSSRSAYLHTGAMLGTWMAANVLFVIIPGQRAMVDAMVKGNPPPLERGQAGSLRSLHNNYLTLPVLFVMISGHFPETWGHPQGWAILAGLGVVGATYRHWVNLHERGRSQPGVLVAALVALVAVAALGRPKPPPRAPDGAAPVAFTQVQQIIAARCLSCHATVPIQPGIAAPPKGVIFEDAHSIKGAAATIYQQVVVSRAMPLGNLTGMTDEERTIIERWAGQEGAGG